jgi:uncharacterized protein (DUF1330 family)
MVDTTLDCYDGFAMKVCNVSFRCYSKAANGHRSPGIMRYIATSVLTLLVGFALGAGAIQGLHAQAGKAPGYAIAEVEVTDPPLYQAYLAKAIDSLKPYNARIIVRAKPNMKEGAPVQGNVVITTFDSLADAEKWYSTPPYKDLIGERQKSAKGRFYIVEGVPQ